MAEYLIKTQYVISNVPHHLKVYKGRINFADTSSPIDE